MTWTRTAALAALLMLAACGEAGQPLAAADPPDDAVCALDGMSLHDYPGPKAQIVFKGGHIDYFCSLGELLEVLSSGDGRHRIGAAYVQDMGKADWHKPRGHWIDARHAFYVTGSRAQGAMGSTVATFARQEDAQSFAAREGGRVLAYGQLQAAALQPAADKVSPTNQEEDKHESIH